VCALCNGVVRWTIRRDQRGVFHYAPLQGTAAREVAGRHPELAGVDSLVLVRFHRTEHERVYLRSDAVLEIARGMGGRWSVFARLSRFVPRVIRDALYGLVARLRYRMFGRYDACPLPPPGVRTRFLE
jgi:predicted DCC family thiol-disulfide oxidoreductase YuxK